MIRKFAAAVAAVLAFLLAASGASAHVTVYPQTAASGTFEKFTVRVPTEKDIPTVGVKVLIPEGVNISRFKPVPGWSYTLERDSTGKIVSVEWTADNEGWASTEFGEFEMTGRIADDAVELVWKAYQTYSDGSVVEWTGAPGSDTPASVTAVVKGSGGGDPHGAAPSSGAATADGSGGSSLSMELTALIISILAMLLSMIALVRILRSRN